MEKVAFIGGYDKTDMIFCIARIFRALGKKVLVVDGTISQKVRYLIPTLTPTMTYITTSDGIDFAIGFDSMTKIKQYMASEGNITEYDYMFFDIDSRTRYRGFEIMPEDRHYLTTSFDVYSLKKAVEVLKTIEMKTPITRVYFTKSITEEKDRYLRLLIKDCSIALRKEYVTFPTDITDIEAIQKNQRDNTVRFKNLTKGYIEGIVYLAEEISGESSGNIKRAIKEIER